MNQQHQQARIACPQCGANNFVGQGQCRQCRAALPQSVPVSAKAWQSPAPMMVAAPPRALLGIALVGVALVAFLVVLLLAGPRRSEVATSPVRVPAPSLTPTPEAAPSETSAADSEGTEADSVRTQAQRELERTQRDMGLPPPAGSVGNDGRVHLRSGGSISTEQWDAARRKLQDSPILQDPPTPHL